MKGSAVAFVFTVTVVAAIGALCAEAIVLSIRDLLRARDKEAS